MEIPRSFSIAIQSEVTPRRPALPCTAPAVLIAAACSASASVSVDLPASGWLITANVRRLPASLRTSSLRAPPAAGRFSTSVTDTAAALLTQRDTQNNVPDRKQGKAKIYSPQRVRVSRTHHDRNQNMRPASEATRPGMAALRPGAGRLPP